MSMWSTPSAIFSRPRPPPPPAGLPAAAAAADLAAGAGRSASLPRPEGRGGGGRGRRSSQQPGRSAGAEKKPASLLAEAASFVCRLGLGFAGHIPALSRDGVFTLPLAHSNVLYYFHFSVFLTVLTARASREVEVFFMSVITYGV